MPNLSYLSLFKDELKDSDFENHWKDNLKLITIMKKPTAEMLRAYYDEYHNVRDVPVVDYYPTDLLIELCENHDLITSVLAENAPRYKGLLEVYDKLCKSNMCNIYENDYGIDKLSDDELKTYEQLVNGDRDLLKKYVKDRLLEIN